MGEDATDFFKLMSAGPVRIWGYQARQILLLRERYATGDLDAALRHAKSFGAFGRRRCVAHPGGPRDAEIAR